MYTFSLIMALSAVKINNGNAIINRRLYIGLQMFRAIHHACRHNQLRPVATVCDGRRQTVVAFAGIVHIMIPRALMYIRSFYTVRAIIAKLFQTLQSRDILKLAVKAEK